MSFTQETFATVGAQSAPSPSVYSYSSSDDLATVVTSSYFTDKQNQLEEGDTIIAFLSDGHAFLEVLPDTSTAQVVNIAVSTEPVVQRFTTPGSISDSTNLVLSTGTHPLVMPLGNEGIIKIKSISGTATLDPGVNTFEGASIVGPTAVRNLYLDGTVWRDL